LLLSLSFETVLMYFKYEQNDNDDDDDDNNTYNNINNNWAVVELHVPLNIKPTCGWLK